MYRNDSPRVSHGSSTHLEYQRKLTSFVHMLFSSRAAWEEDRSNPKTQLGWQLHPKGKTFWGQRRQCDPWDPAVPPLQAGISGPDHPAGCWADLSAGATAQPGAPLAPTPPPTLSNRLHNACHTAQPSSWDLCVRIWVSFIPAIFGLQCFHFSNLPMCAL